MSGFLILAAIVSSMAFILSNSSRDGATENVANKNEPSAPTKQVPKRAFAEPIAQKNEAATAETVEANLAAKPGNNFTDNLAQYFTNQMLSVGQGGNPNFFPDKKQFGEMAALGLIPNNWRPLNDLGLQRQIRDKELKLVDATDNDTLKNYVNGLRVILANTILSEKLKSKFTDQISDEAVLSFDTALDQADVELKKLTTPKIFSGFHKQILVYLEDQKKLLEVSQTYNEDPLKGILVLEAVKKEGGSILENDLANLQSAMSKLEKESYFYENPANKFFAFIKNIFAPRAVAFTGAPGLGGGGGRAGVGGLFVPVDCVGPSCVRFFTRETLNTGHLIPIDSTTRGHFLFDVHTEEQRKLTDQLKRQLIALIQREVVAWIQGGGEPKFITDWQGFLGQAFNIAASNLISSKVPQLCSSFGSLVGLTLQPPQNPYSSTDLSLTCTLNRIIGNTTGFFNDWTRGGLAGYIAVLNDNFFVRTMQLHDIALNEALSAQAAAKNKGIAGQGFLGIELCSDGSKPQGQSRSCPPGTIAMTTTPGQAIAAALAKAMGSHVDLLTNAYTWEGLIAAVLDAALTRLINAGLSGLANLYQTPAPSSLSSLCSGLSGQALTDCQNTANGANNTSGQGSQPLGVSCYANQDQVDTGDAASFSAYGGNNSYSWSAPGGNPPSSASTSISSEFSTVYSSSGTKMVTVASGSSTSSCSVVVVSSTASGVSCSPSTQTVGLGEDANFAAIGGNNAQDYNWSAPDGSPSSGIGSSFTTRYLSGGTRAVTVTNAGNSDACSVTAQ